MAEHGADKEKKKKAVEKDYRKNVLLNSKFERYLPVFLEMQTEIKSIWTGHLERKHVSKHHIDLINDEVWPVQSAHTSRTKGRQSGTAKINCMIYEKVKEPLNDEWAAPFVFEAKKDNWLCFCADYRKLNAVALLDSYLHLVWTNVLTAGEWRQWF